MSRTKAYNWKITPGRTARAVARQMVKLRCPGCGNYYNTPSMARHKCKGAQVAHGD